MANETQLERVMKMSEADLRTEYAKYEKMSKALGGASSPAFVQLRQEYPNASALQYCVAMRCLDAKWTFNEEYMQERIKQAMSKQQRASLRNAAVENGRTSRSSKATTGPKTIHQIKADVSAQKLMLNARLQGVTDRHVAQHLPVLSGVTASASAGAETAPTLVSALSTFVDLASPPPTDNMASRMFSSTMLSNLLGPDAAAMLAKAAASVEANAAAAPNSGAALPATGALGRPNASATLELNDDLPAPKNRVKREMPDPGSQLLQREVIPRANWPLRQDPKDANKSILLDLTEGPASGSCLWFDWVFEDATLLVSISLSRSTSVTCRYLNYEDVISLRFQRVKDAKLWNSAPLEVGRIAKNIQHIPLINEWTVEVALPSGVLSLSGVPPLRIDEKSVDENLTYFRFQLEKGPPEKKSQATTSSSLGKCL